MFPHCLKRKHLRDTVFYLFKTSFKKLISSILILFRIEHILHQCLVLVCNDCCTYSITCDINGSSCHIQDTVDTHDQTNCLNRKSDRIEYHCQCYQTYTWHTGRTDGCKCCSSDYSNIICHT